MNIFATSREIPEIMEAFDKNGSTNLPIRASDEDIRIFLSDQMKGLHPRVLDRPSLQEQIKNKIVDAAQGMYVFFPLRLNYYTPAGHETDI